MMMACNYSPTIFQSCWGVFLSFWYSKTCVKRTLSKRQKTGFQDQLSLNAGQKYCRLLRGEHSAILLTFIKLPFVITIFVLPIFEWPFYTGFTILVFGDQVYPPV